MAKRYKFITTGIGTYFLVWSIVEQPAARRARTRRPLSPHPPGPSAPGPSGIPACS
jgi:hypothetical protein